MIVGVCWILKHSYILGLRKESPCFNQKYHSFSLCSKTIYEQELSQCLDGHWRSIGTPKSPKETPCYFMAYQRNFQSCLSVHRGSPCGHYPWCIGPHSKPPPALVLILIPPPDIWHWTPLALSSSRHGTWGPLYAGPSASDIWRPLLEICSNLFIGPHCTAPHPPLILTSGDHWGTYNCQADSTHPTGMLPCLWY